MPGAQYWEVTHKDHSGVAYGGVYPNGLNFAIQLNQVGTINYNIPYRHTLAIEDYTRPYLTDFELKYGTRSIMAGMHTDTDVNDLETGLLGVAGKDWMHYFEKLEWPFDPTNPTAALYKQSKNIILVVKDLLDTSLAQPNALSFTYALVSTGSQSVNYEIAPADTEKIYSKISTLGTTSPGFDWYIDANRNITVGVPQIGAQGAMIFETGKNIYKVQYTNHGPNSTRLHAYGSVAGINQGVILDYISQAAYRLLMDSTDFGDVGDQTFLANAALAEQARQSTDVIEFSTQYIQGSDEYDFWNEITVGNTYLVRAALNGYKTLNDYYRLVGLQVAPDDEGVTTITLSWDDRNLSL